MDPAVLALSLSWSFEPALSLGLLLSAGIYLRGWMFLRAHLPHRFNGKHIACFFGALGTILVALTSPLHSLAAYLLYAHMLQHILLMMVAPPLLLLGAPLFPFLHGLPGAVLKRHLGGLIRSRVSKRIAACLTHPLVGLGSFTVATLIWHVPFMYELALRSGIWHEVEHLCFLSTGLFFWWPIVQPWPSRARWSRWVLIPYLLFADLVNTALSAFLCFAERVLYPTYALAPRLWELSALEDQARAGALMWVLGSLAFLIPVGWILHELLEPSLVDPMRPKPHPRTASDPKLLIRGMEAWIPNKKSES